MTEKALIHVIEPEGPLEWFKPLEGLAEVRFVYPDENFSDTDLRDILRVTNGIIITSRCGVNGENMSFTNNLGIIAKCGGKPSNVDIAEATKRGIAVSYVPGANNTTVAEYSVLLILASLRNLNEHTEAIMKDKWRTNDTLLGFELRNKIVGIIGYGAVGREVARKLQGFDCQIIVYDPYVDIKENEFGNMTPTEELAFLLSESDVISVNCSLTNETENLISDPEFALMKPQATIINTARGPIINESALVRALENEIISAASIDVYSKEPINSNHPFSKQNNIVLTPHVAAWTVEALFREVNGAVLSTIAYLKGNNDIPGLLNPDFRKFNVTG